jgi:hypothetical protein
MRRDACFVCVCFAGGARLPVVGVGQQALRLALEQLRRAGRQSRRDACVWRVYVVMCQRG